MTMVMGNTCMLPVRGLSPAKPRHQQTWMGLYTLHGGGGGLFRMGRIGLEVWVTPLLRRPAHRQHQPLPHFLQPKLNRWSQIQLIFKQNALWFKLCGVALKNGILYQKRKRVGECFLTWKKLQLILRWRELVCACLPPKNPASKTGRHQHWPSSAPRQDFGFLLFLDHTSKVDTHTPPNVTAFINEKTTRKCGVILFIMAVTQNLHMCSQVRM